MGFVELIGFEVYGACRVYGVCRAYRVYKFIGLIGFMAHAVCTACRV